MDNPQELKKLLIQQLIEQGRYKQALKSLGDDLPELKELLIKQLIEDKEYEAVLNVLDDGQELKPLLVKQMISDGKYETALDSLNYDTEKAEAKNVVAKLGTLASKLTDAEQRADTLDSTLEKTALELRQELTTAHSVLTDTLKASLEVTSESMTSNMLLAIAKAQSELQTAQEAFTTQLIEEKAKQLLPSLIEAAKLNPEQLNDLIDKAALSVESQIALIISAYVAEAGITTSQITDFKEAVRELLPKLDFSKAVINWSQIKGAPAMGGGTNALVVQSMINTALAPFATSKTLVYNADGTLLSSTDAFGSKTFNYTAGVLTSLVGSGIYKSKTFTYNGSSQLTNITV